MLVSSIICLVSNKEWTKNINRQFQERSIRKDFQLHSSSENASSNNREILCHLSDWKCWWRWEKTSQVEVQVGTMPLENNFQKKKKLKIFLCCGPEITLLAIYSWESITLRPQKACKKTMLINVMAKIVQWLLHARYRSKSFLCSHCIIFITHLPQRKHTTLHRWVHWDTEVYELPQLRN